MSDMVRIPWDDGTEREVEAGTLVETMGGLIGRADANGMSLGDIVQVDAKAAEARRRALLEWEARQ